MSTTPEPRVRHHFRPGDIGRIVYLHGTLYPERGWDHTFEAYVAVPLGEFASRSNPREKVWLVDVDEQLEGSLAIVEASETEAQLRWLLLTPRLRGRGIGRKIVEEAIAFCRASGYASLFLWTVEGLDASAALYASLGFRLVRSEPRELWGAHVVEQRYELALPAQRTIQIFGQLSPRSDWAHRFRNFGEAVYARLGGHHDVSIEEIDAALDTFHLRGVAAEEVAAVEETLTAMLREHHLDDSVFLRRGDAGRTVVIVADPTCGERLEEIAARHPAWVVPSDANRAAVLEMWDGSKEGRNRSSITIWSTPTPTESEEDWLAILDVIELHHGPEASRRPVDCLNVYGASVTPALTAALRAYDYDVVQATALGFMAWKERR